MRINRDFTQPKENGAKNERRSPGLFSLPGFSLLRTASLQVRCSLRVFHFPKPNNGRNSRRKDREIEVFAKKRNCRTCRRRLLELRSPAALSLRHGTFFEHVFKLRSNMNCGYISYCIVEFEHNSSGVGSFRISARNYPPSLAIAARQASVSAGTAFCCRPRRAFNSLMRRRCEA